MKHYLLTAVWPFALVACTTEPAPGLANPAATYCVQFGAHYQIRDGKDGQTGICTLPDGREVDAWEYYRENNPG